MFICYLNTAVNLFFLVDPSERVKSPENVKSPKNSVFSSRIFNLVTHKMVLHDSNDQITSYFFRFDAMILSLAKVMGLQSRQKQGPQNAFPHRTYF